MRKCGCTATERISQSRRVSDGHLSRAPISTLSIIWLAFWFFSLPSHSKRRCEFMESRHVGLRSPVHGSRRKFPSSLVNRLRLRDAGFAFGYDFIALVGQPCAPLKNHRRSRSVAMRLAGAVFTTTYRTSTAYIYRVYATDMDRAFRRTQGDILLRTVLRHPRSSARMSESSAHEKPQIASTRFNCIHDHGA